MRTGESRGGFRSSEENNGQAGGLTCGGGDKSLRLAGGPVAAVSAFKQARLFFDAHRLLLVFTPGELETVQARVRLYSRSLL